MKRLTISMSDELFSKLDSVENKSLFIRKLIERELDTLDSINDIDSNIPWERDITALKGNVDELFAKLSEIEIQLGQTIIQKIPALENQPCPSFACHEERQTENIDANIPELSETAVPNYEEECLNAPGIENIETQGILDENSSSIPAHVQEDKYSFLTQEDTLAESQPNIPTESEIDEIPAPVEAENVFENVHQECFEEINPIDETIQEPSMVMPELKPPVETQNEQAIAPPEFEAPVEKQQEQDSEIQDPGQSAKTEQRQIWTMPPELESSIEAQGEQKIAMPELRQPVGAIQEQAFVMPELEPPVETKPEDNFVMPELKPSTEPAQEQVSLMQELESPMETQYEPEMTITDTNTPFTGPRSESLVMPELSSPESAGQVPPFMPELNSPAEDNNQSFTIPEFKTPAETQNEQTFVMPELEIPVETQNESGIVMPELKPPVTIPDNKPNPGTNLPFASAENETLVMPELSSPEGAGQVPPFVAEMSTPNVNAEQTFTMPDLKPPIETGEVGNFKLPELKSETTPFMEAGGQQSIPAVEKQSLFKIHNIDSQQEEKKPPFVAPAFDPHPENIQAPPFEKVPAGINSPAREPPMSQQVGNTKTTSPVKNNSSKPDKLGSNILMYMPHGAKVKKDIIKSLISKQFSNNEIEAKISEMISSGVLKLAAENETHFLIRP